MAARSLRAQLLRMLLPPIAALLALGAVVAYYPSAEPATEAYDQALLDIGVALGAHIRVSPTEYRFELPAAVEQVLRTDRHDVIFYRVLSPSGLHIAGDPSLPPPPGDAPSYNRVFNGQKVRVVSVGTPCGRSTCTVLVAETTNKRARAAREFLLTSMLPGILIALATLLIVWFGVKRGLWPLARLSEELKARSPRDLRPIDAAAAPEETRPLVAALNGLLEEVAQTTISRLLSSTLPNPPDLIKLLSPFANQGRLVGWSPNADEEDLFDRMRMSGKLPTLDGGDGLAVVINNVGNNKIDYYLTGEVSYTVDTDPVSGTATATLDITLRNGAPPGATEPSIVFGNSEGAPPASNVMELSVYSAMPVTAMTVDTVARPADAISSTEEFDVSTLNLQITAGSTTQIQVQLAGPLDLGTPGFRLARSAAVDELLELGVVEPEVVVEVGP